MKNKLSPFLVGSFVLGCLALIVVALLSFRSLHLFSNPGRFVAYFNESVQGLDVGSAVKLRGVRVGRVASIHVNYDSNARKSQVAVVAELDKSAISDREGHIIQITDRVIFQQLIDNGLRAKMDLVGITGLQFVQLDFFDPAAYPAPNREGEEKYPVVPTLRSGMSELVGNLSNIATNLNKVDFAGLSRELQSLMGTVNRQISAVDLKQMVGKVSAAADSIAALASSDDARGAFANLNQTSDAFRGLVTKLDSQVEPVGMELMTTMRSFHATAESIRKLTGPQTGLGEETVHTLQQVAEAARSLERLADFLERNPSTLITGRKRPDKEP